MNDRHSLKSPYDPATYLKGGSEPKPVENAALLPALNDPYKAGGFAEHEVSRLVLVMGRDGFHAGANAYIAFQYVHIGMGQLGFTRDGQVFSFVFSDIQPKLFTVHGRNVLRIFDQISLRRMPWIREADRDYRQPGAAPDTEPIITRIEVEDWKRPREQADHLAEVLDMQGA